nr:hypothetical protein [Klebsiella oxytoca]
MPPYLKRGLYSPYPMVYPLIQNRFYPLRAGVTWHSPGKLLFSQNA